ncbi:DnaJ domain-containing protein [Tanacetum coccineum]
MARCPRTNGFKKESSLNSLIWGEEDRQSHWWVLYYIDRRSGSDPKDGTNWEDSFDTTDNKKKRDPQKASARRATKANQKRNKSKSKKGSIYDDFDDDPGTHFRATFGNRWHSWSFQSWEESFYQSQTSGFKWREEPDRRNKWRTISDDESDEDDDQPSVIGSHSDRTALGLPINGPLKIEDVKNAFRLSALKWHPDKHQGPSQALAEEKFKCKQGVPSLHVKDRRSMLKVNLIGPHDTQYCMEDPEQAFVEYASSRTDETGEGFVSNFMASQYARLTKFEAEFKQHQSEIANKIDTVLKAITDRIAGALQFCLLVLTQQWTRNAQPMSMVRSTLSRYIPSNKTTPVITWLRKKSKKERATPKTPTPWHTLKNNEILHYWSGKT